MRSQIIFVTGTDTGVGKTVLTCLLLRYLRQQGCRALAMKPFCSGGRDDIEKLQRFQPGELSDEEIAPYYFRQPLAPAANGLKRRIVLSEVTRKIRKLSDRCEVLLVEGIGGLLAPLTFQMTLADVIREFELDGAGKVVVVGPNRLGVLNHVLLTCSALQKVGQKRVAIVLMDQARSDLASRSNARVLSGMLGAGVIFRVPFLAEEEKWGKDFKKSGLKIKKTLARLVDR